MGSREILLSSIGGFRETMVIDESRPGDLLIKTYEDSETLKEHARVLSDTVPGKEFRHVAVIPMHVLDKAMRDGCLNDKAWWKRWGNDPDNSRLRTWPGRL